MVISKLHTILLVLAIVILVPRLVVWHFFERNFMSDSSKVENLENVLARLDSCYLIYLNIMLILILLTLKIQERLTRPLHVFRHFNVENVDHLDDEHFDGEDLDEADESEIIYETITYLY